MTITIDFVPFATGPGANVTSQANYLAAGYLDSGFAAGIAQSAPINKAIRQSTFVASALAHFVGTVLNANVLDDGNLAGFTTQLTNALLPTAPNIIAALGYTPVNRAGDTMTGPLIASRSPLGANEVATKAYVDGAATGLQVKATVVAATTANITLSGAQTIDTVAVVAGQRVLVKNQAAPENNGIYVVAAGAWTRSTDADTWAEVDTAFTFVTGGSVNLNTGWACNSGAGGTLGTTAITFVQTSAAGSYGATGGLLLTGSNFSLAPIAAATVLGSIAGGTPVALTMAQLQALLAAAGVSVVTGEVKWFAGTVAPTGYLECNGATISRTTYAALFAVINTTFGAGDGSTTFGLPDLRGEFVRGWDHGRGKDPGRVFGIEQAGQPGPVNIYTTAVSGGGSALTYASGGDNTVYNQTVLAPGGGNETRPVNIDLMGIIKI